MYIAFALLKAEAPRSVVSFSAAAGPMRRRRLVPSCLQTSGDCSELGFLIPTV